MIRWIRRKLYPLTSMFLAHARLVEGSLKGTNHSFRCLLVGNSTFTEYLQARTYESPPVVLKKGRVWIPSLRKLIQKRAGGFDLCVAVVPMAYESTFSGLYDYRCREGVRQVIPTSGSWEEVRSRFSRKRRQTTNDFVEKHGLGYRISSSLEEFDFFYHRMHVPHIRKRYGELSAIDSYEDMKRFFLKGLLLFVTKDGKPVAGALSLIQDRVLVFRRTGVLDGDESHIDGGAQTALYYFQLRYANEHGFRAVDAMMSAPFLNDGVYRHKRDWGATVYPDNESGTWVYFFGAGPSDKLVRFFESNPLIVCSDEGLRAVIGISGATEVSQAAAKGVVDRHRADGLQGFTILTPAGVLSAS